MLKILNLFSLFLLSYSRDNCDVTNGFTWCETSHKCVRILEEPCLPITKECASCLSEEIITNCGGGCSNDVLEAMVSNGFRGTDEYGCSINETTLWCPSLNRCINPLEELCRDIVIDPASLCHEVTCGMFCNNGFQKDSNGCDICFCNENVNSPSVNLCELEEQVCPYIYVCPLVTEITHCSEDGIQGYTTYQLSLLLKDGTDARNIYALYGDSYNNIDGNTMYIPPAYQELDGIFNSNFGGISQELIDIHPNSRYDSWITIGLTNGDPQHKLSSVGIDIDSWNQYNPLEVTNGALFVLNPEEKIINEEEYIIMQLTLPNTINANVIVNVQGKKKYARDSWNEKNINFKLSKPTSLETDIPIDCISWFDGCNTCFTDNGIKGECSRTICSSISDPHCLTYMNGH
jgi:hypothetical protein